MYTWIISKQYSWWSSLELLAVSLRRPTHTSSKSPPHPLKDHICTYIYIYIYIYIYYDDLSKKERWMHEVGAQQSLRSYTFHKHKTYFKTIMMSEIVLDPLLEFWEESLFKRLEQIVGSVIPNHWRCWKGRRNFTMNPYFTYDIF